MLPTDSGATLSLILGITGLATAGIGLCCCIGYVAGPCFGVAAAVIGHSSLARINAHLHEIRGREQAIAGLVTGYATIALTLGGMIIAVLSVGFQSLMARGWSSFGF